MRKLVAKTGWALVMTIVCGCQQATQPVAPPSPTAASTPAPSSAPTAPAMPATVAPAAQTPAPTAVNPQASPEAAPRKAQPGVAKQGRSLDNEQGVGRMIAQPVKTLFAVKERMVFTTQIPQALQLFEASEGRKPKSHQEFMDKIIKANNIQLPQLPAGQEYNYHVDTGDLWVHPTESQPAKTNTGS